MATVILLKADELTKNTILGGNIDVSRYSYAIKDAQNTLIKEVLTKPLYEKIQQDFRNNDLTGVYLEMYDDYIQPMVIYAAAELYLSIGAYKVSDAGITKLNSLEGTTSATRQEIAMLVQSARRMFEYYKSDFEKWIKTVNIIEYANSCTADRILVGGWSIKKK